MKNILDGTKILLIGPGYHDYISVIASAFMKLGASVELFKSDPSSIFYNNFYLSRLKKLRVLKKFYNEQVYKNNREILESIRNKHFDYVIIVKGRLVTEEFLINLKCLLYKATFILYQWDSLKNYNYMDKMKYFDSIFSFDYSDSENIPGVKYLPLFFSDEYAKISHLQRINYKYDLFFLGYNHSIRVKKLKDMAQFCEEKGLKYSFNMMTSISEKMKLFLQRSKINCFFISRRFDQFSENYIKSKAIVDISSPAQTGLTFRIIEAIGANKKIITTNINITREPFYDPKLIFIWGRDDTENLINFLNQKHERKSFENYSVKSFVLNLISQIRVEQEYKEIEY
jgi:hypothetical protein